MKYFNHLINWLDRKVIVLFITSCIALHLHAQLPSYIPTNGLVAYWPFNKNANDKSLNGNNGTVDGATLTNDRFGNLNQAYFFDGIDDYIEIPHSPQLNLTNQISISAWIRTYSATNSQRIVDKVTVGSSDSWMLDCGGEKKKVRLICGNATGAQPISKDNFIEDSIWVHVTVTFDGDTAKFYKNSVLDSVFIHTGVTGGNSNAIKIGANTKLNGDFFHGVLDEILIWDRALFPAEISTLYKGSSVGLTSYNEIPDLNFYSSNKRITIENKGQHRKFDIAIYALDGRLVYNSKVDIKNGKTEIELEMPEGIYLIEVSDQNHRQAKKIKY